MGCKFYLLRLIPEGGNEINNKTSEIITCNTIKCRNEIRNVLEANLRRKY